MLTKKDCQPALHWKRNMKIKRARNGALKSSIVVC